MPYKTRMALATHARTRPAGNVSHHPSLGLSRLRHHDMRIDDVSLRANARMFNRHLWCVPGNESTAMFGTNASDACHDYLDAECRRSGLCQAAIEAAAQPSNFFVIVVHYTRAPCRRQFVSEMLARLKLNTSVAWTSGYDAEDLTLGMLRKCVVDRPFCNGKGSLSVRQTAELKTASVTINHMLAFRMAAASGAPVTIVLEDDAELPDDFLERFQKDVMQLPRGWHLFQFGCPEIRSRGLMRQGAQCVRGYALSHAGAELFSRAAGLGTAVSDVLVRHVLEQLTDELKIESWGHYLSVRELSMYRGRKLPRGTDVCNRSKGYPLFARQRAVRRRSSSQGRLVDPTRSPLRDSRSGRSSARPNVEAQESAEWWSRMIVYTTVALVLLVPACVLTIVCTVGACDGGHGDEASSVSTRPARRRLGGKPT